MQGRLKWMYGVVSHAPCARERLADAQADGGRTGHGWHPYGIMHL